MKISEKRCWKGYKPTPGKKPYSKGSCMKESYKLIGKVIAEGAFMDRLRSGARKVGGALKDPIRAARTAALVGGMALAGKYGKERYYDQYSDPNYDTQAVDSGTPETAFERQTAQFDPNWKDRWYTQLGRKFRNAVGTRNLDQKAVWGMHDLITGRNREKEMQAKRGQVKPGQSGWYGTNESLIVKEGKSPAWQRSEGKNPEGGLNKKGIASYRAANPGSKLSMAVTTKPSKLKKGSKSAKRRKSFCARMGGMKKRLTSSKTASDPNSRINKALRKWNC